MADTFSKYNDNTYRLLRGLRRTNPEQDPLFTDNQEKRRQPRRTKLVPVYENAILAHCIVYGEFWYSQITGHEIVYLDDDREKDAFDDTVDNAKDDVQEAHDATVYRDLEAGAGEIDAGGDDLDGGDLKACDPDAGAGAGDPDVGAENGDLSVGGGDLDADDLKANDPDTDASDLDVGRRDLKDDADDPDADASDLNSGITEDSSKLYREYCAYKKNDKRPRKDVKTPGGNASFKRDTAQRDAGQFSSYQEHTYRLLRGLRRTDPCNNPEFTERKERFKVKGQRRFIPIYSQPVLVHCIRYGEFLQWKLTGHELVHNDKSDEILKECGELQNQENTQYAVSKDQSSLPEEDFNDTAYRYYKKFDTFEIIQHCTDTTVLCEPTSISSSFIEHGKEQTTAHVPLAVCTDLSVESIKRQMFQKEIKEIYADSNNTTANIANVNATAESYTTVKETMDNSRTENAVCTKVQQPATVVDEFRTTDRMASLSQQMDDDENVSNRPKAESLRISADICATTTENNGQPVASECIRQDVQDNMLQSDEDGLTPVMDVDIKVSNRPQAVSRSDTDICATTTESNRPPVASEGLEQDVQYTRLQSDEDGLAPVIDADTNVSNRPQAESPRLSDTDICATTTESNRPPEASEGLEQDVQYAMLQSDEDGLAPVMDADTNVSNRPQAESHRLSDTDICATTTESNRPPEASEGLEQDVQYAMLQSDEDGLAPVMDADTNVSNRPQAESSRLPDTDICAATTECNRPPVASEGIGQDVQDDLLSNSDEDGLAPVIDTDEKVSNRPQAEPIRMSDTDICAATTESNRPPVASEGIGHDVQDNTLQSDEDGLAPVMDVDTEVSNRPQAEPIRVSVTDICATATEENRPPVASEGLRLDVQDNMPPKSDEDGLAPVMDVDKQVSNRPQAESPRVSDTDICVITTEKTRPSVASEGLGQDAQYNILQSNEDEDDDFFFSLLGVYARGQ